jgi:hypothetical protein
MDMGMLDCLTSGKTVIDPNIESVWIQVIC